MSGLFQDREGNESSKRVIGFWVTVLGVASLLSVLVNSLIWPCDYGPALDAGKTLFGGGMALLGIGVFEFLGKGR